MQGARPRAAVARVVRESVIQDLEPDLVVVPAGFADPGDVVVCSAGELPVEFPTVFVWLAESRSPAEGGEAAIAGDWPRVGTDHLAAAHAIYVESDAWISTLTCAGANTDRIRDTGFDFTQEPDALAARVIADGNRNSQGPRPPRGKPWPGHVAVSRSYRRCRLRAPAWQRTTRGSCRHLRRSTTSTS